MLTKNILRCYLDSVSHWLCKLRLEEEIVTIPSHVGVLDVDGVCGVGDNWQVVDVMKCLYYCCCYYLCE